MCEARVKTENLESHMKKQHPHEKVDLRSASPKKEGAQSPRTKGRKGPRISRKTVGLLVAMVVIIVILVVIATLPRPRSVGPGVGQIAPDFTLQTTDGGYVTLSLYRGRPILLAFIDIDGAPCQAECEILASVYETYGTRVFFFSIDVDYIQPEDTADRINDFRTSKDTPWAYALDPDGSVTDAYDIDVRPNVFIIDEEGVVSKTFEGRAPNGYASYAAALNDVLSG